MPELPDIEVYREAIERRVKGQTLERVRLASPFLLRTVSPAPEDVCGRAVSEVRRVGKRIAIGLEDDGWLVLHLMIAGRLEWKRPGGPIPGGRRGLAGFDFTSGTLILTEAGTRKRASLHVLAGEAAWRALDPGGLEPLTATCAEFAAAVARESHTLKRTLTDPRLFSGIGNAYSDEILHAACLSPTALSRNLKSDEVERLWQATRGVLVDWLERLRLEAAGEFPKHVTAFRPAMAVHGRYGEACPRCQSRVARIRYADNETNYCPVCQTGGKLLADRSLSRLLHDDWPRTLEGWEALTAK